MSEDWSAEGAERHLRSLERFGMRFGLERMWRMMTVLGLPQQRFSSIHVVGTNGKSSTTRMIAAILERHGLRTGSYLSPHLVSYRERVQVGERDIETDAFAAAIARAAWAAKRVNSTLAGDDHVTQFELLTAAAFWELAERGVQVAVVEAGLGGRYDATNVLDADVVALTNVGLEHTRWLGPTLRDIATEKLAVAREGATLALGVEPHPEVLELARRLASERSVAVLEARALGPGGASVDADGPGAVRRGGEGVGPGQGEEGLFLRARGSFQRRNFALARVAARAYIHSAGIVLREDAVRAAAACTVVPGRLQVVDVQPLTVLDAAHNRDAVAALLESLPDLLDDRPLALVFGVLDDKDAAGMLAMLLARCERAWFAAPTSARALPPAALESLARRLGFQGAVCEPSPHRALRAARSWARTREDAAVLATGSVYLVGDLLARAPELRAAATRRTPRVSALRPGGALRTRGASASPSRQAEASGAEN